MSMNAPRLLPAASSPDMVDDQRRIAFAPEFLTMLEDIPWLASCGQPVQVPPGAERIHSWADAEIACCAMQWETVTIDARNELLSFLQSHDRRRFNHWYEYVAEAKEVIVKPLSTRLWQPYAQRHGVGSEVISCMEWDILAAAMEHAYRGLPDMPQFFTRLLAVYQSGHFPCGWTSKSFAEGQVIAW